MSELPTCFSVKDRIARKSHKCCECKQEIKPGEKYRYSSGIWDSVPESYKQCNTCAAIFDVCIDINNEQNNFLEEGPAFCNLVEFVETELCYHRESAQRFDFGSNPFWQQMIERINHDN